MSIKLKVPEKNVMHLKPRISVIGVGGGGGNAVNNMIEQKLEGVDFVVANTDAQALANSKASRKIQLGMETTKGLGAGARPEVGKAAAEEALEEIKRELEGSNMVFITAGMGGGTGSGAAPVVARAAKEMGILTVGVVTKPFQFEGRKRGSTAETAVDNFTKEVDSIIVIPNQNLFRVADKNTTLVDAFIMADNVLYAGVRSITDLMLMPGLINLDFADIKAIMEDKGKAIMGTGEADGDERAVKAAEQALSNPLLDDCSIRGAKGVLINITGGSDITLFEIDEAASRIKEEVDEEANIIFGSSFDDDLKGKIRVSIVATGIGDSKPVTRVKPQVAKPVMIEEEVITKTSRTVINANLEQFAAHREEKEESEEETVRVIASKVIEEQEKFEDFDELESSSTIGEMPKASSLFKAIINNNESASHSEQLEDILSSNEKHFTPKAVLREVEEEPELFPEHNTGFVHKKIEEQEELIVGNNDEDYRPTLIERVTGFSIAKKNKKKKIESFQEPISPSFSKDLDDDSKLNLEIPSFLRRR